MTTDLHMWPPLHTCSQLSVSLAPRAVSCRCGRWVRACATNAQIVVVGGGSGSPPVLGFRVISLRIFCSLIFLHPCLGFNPCFWDVCASGRLYFLWALCLCPYFSRLVIDPPNMVVCLFLGLILISLMGFLWVYLLGLF